MTNHLREAATAARLRAYAPYSRFLVGAALLCDSGAIVTGCNVENVSLGLTICAERACLTAAIERGERAFRELMIVAETAEPIVPCGACRQMLAEFSPNLSITSYTLFGDCKTFNLSNLLPLPKQGILGVPRGT